MDVSLGTLPCKVAFLLTIIMSTRSSRGIVNPGHIVDPRIRSCNLNCNRNKATARSIRIRKKAARRHTIGYTRMALRIHVDGVRDRSAAILCKASGAMMTSLRLNRKAYRCSPLLRQRSRERKDPLQSSVGGESDSRGQLNDIPRMRPPA